MNPRVLDVSYNSPRKLILFFDNFERREFDFKKYLTFPVYQVLNDENYCAKAKVFNGTVIWDDYVDFDPDTLYLESNSVILV